LPIGTCAKSTSISSASGLSARTIFRARSRPCGEASETVHHDDVGELDLLDQEVDQRTVVAIAGDLTAVAQEILRGIVLQKVRRVDDRDHCVEA
jgi:hypothetical protein